VTKAHNAHSLDIIAKHNIFYAVGSQHNKYLHYLAMLFFTQPQQKKELSILLSFVTISLYKTFEFSLQAHL